MAIWNVDTVATTWGITRAEAKIHLRIDSGNTTFDDLIDDYIAAASEMLFRWANVAAGNMTLKGYFRDWEDYKIYVEPVATVASIKYYDTNNSQQTLSTANYRTYLDAYPKEIEITTEPTLFDRPDAVEVAITTGYTVTPEAVKQALLLIVKDLFDVPMENYKDIDREWFSLNTRLAISLISRRDEV